MATLEKYGLTVEDYDVMLQEQGGVCSCCEKAPNANRRLIVDGSRQTKTVHGLICSGCFNILRHVWGKPETKLCRLNLVVQYLENCV